MIRGRVACSVAAAWLMAATPGAVEAQQPPGLPPQQAEVRADIVLVDVSVVDDRGRPVTDLRPSEFVLQVEGQPRSIQTAQFLAASPPAAARQVDAAAQAREALTTSNAGPSSGRLLLLAVDESYLKVGANRAVLRAAESVLDRLLPGDHVGLARIPGGTGGVEFTTNRDAVRTALRGVTGRFQLGATSDVYLSESVDFVHGTRDRWPAAVARECDPTDRLFEACVNALESAASQLVTDHEARTRSTLRYLEGVFTRLRAMNMPVNLILISEGLFLGPDLRGEVARVAARAAESRVSLHIVRPDPQLYDVGDRRPAPDARQDDALLRDGLDELAASMRGGLFSAAGSPSAVFDRIGNELSGYYLLGFEPTADDQNGRDRRIKVEVRRRGVIVRARPSFALRPPAPPPATAADRLEQALVAPVPAAGVPIRVATYLATTGDDGQVRVIIGAEIGDRVQDAATTPVGLVVVDRAGKAIASDLGDAELRPALDSAASPRLYIASVIVPPGDYTLRLAAGGPDGQVGVVHHPFAARLRDAGAGLRVSDLLVVSPAVSGQSRPSPSGIVDSDRVTVMLDAQHRDAAALSGVTVSFEIAQAGRNRPVMDVAAESVARENQVQRSFGKVLLTEKLPPGEYVARARIEAEGRPPTVIERPFRLERTPGRASAAARAVSPASAAVVRPRAAPPLPARFMVPALRFAVDDVLRPEIVNPFLSYLEANLKPTDAVRPIIEQARKGTFVQKAPAAGTRPDDLVLAFVGGLAALEKGELPQATALFQRTLRGAPEFVGIAFFLGAAHAAAGRDGDAAGAWQMSLLSPEAEPAYRFLVDALLRVGQASRALDALVDAPDSAKASAAIQERVAIAEAVAGRDSALPKLQALIAARPSDPDLLIVGIQVLYRQHLRAPLTGEPLALFDEWTRRYEQTRGDSRPSLAPWRSYVLP